MWINQEVQLPESLIAAQRNRELVIFAGAGVSMGAPSNLPDFDRLAKDVVQGAIELGANEPLDRFLGRAEDKGVDVQERTRRIIGNPASQPTVLHEGLLGLFPVPEAIRVITTNFDRHFTTVARNRFKDTVDIYCAPALPLGHNLRGIIYLHGSVDLPRDRLVLSDADFGRAYLTERWATRMLVDVFLHYTVLFVGYSHNDPVMSYLARSLVPHTRRRFALTQPGQEEKWAFLGISPVNFPLREGADRFGALTDVVKDWGLLARMGALDHERRIREVVARAPPIEQNEADYIAEALADPVMLRFFVGHARSPEWLRWADERGAFKRLFFPSYAVTDGDREIAKWFSAHYAFEHPGEALKLVHRHGMRLGREFWELMTWALWTHKPRPSADLLNQWVVLLLNSMGNDYPTRHLSNLFAKCDESDVSTALLLLNCLTRLQVRFEKPLTLSEDEPPSPLLRVEVEVIGEYEQLKKAWDEYFRPKLGTLRHMLRPMLTGRIAEAYLLHRGTADAKNAFDALSYRRSAIEPHGQDRFPTAFDFVIDATRDLLEWLVEHEPTEASALIQEWGKSDIALLRRLAIHGLTKDQRLPPDAALEFVQTHNWLYAHDLKHEVFRLLKAKYPEATEPVRAQFLAHSMEASVIDEEETGSESARGTIDYERYNVAVWLRRIAPNSKVTMRHFETLQKAHPDFGERDHPDLSHWSSGGYWGTPKSPISADELLAKTPGEHLKFLLEFGSEGTAIDALDRDGLSAAVREAVSKSFDWGWDLALALRDAKAWDTDLWGDVLKGWRALTLDAVQWTRVLSFVNDSPALDGKFSRAIVDLLEGAVEEEKAADTAALRPQVEAIGDRIIATADKQDNLSSGRKDWLTLAINHAHGRVMMLWLKALAARRADVGNSWSELPPDYRMRFERIIISSGIGAQRARIVLASQTHLLFALDAEWTTTHLLPVFDWRQDALRAEQSWHGYIGWGQWNDALFRALLPFLEQCYPRFERELVEIRGEFCDRLSGVALYASFDPWHEGGWLTHFIRDAGVKSREVWALQFRVSLKELSPEAKKTAWDRWIHDYWADRLTGVPRPLSERERSAMLEWIFELEPVLPDVIAKILAASAPLEQDEFFFFSLCESDLPAKHPNDVARLVRHVLGTASAVRYACEYIDTVTRTLLASGADPTELRAICEAMAHLGCPTAPEIRGLVETANGNS
jgi:hypothetical protein